MVQLAAEVIYENDYGEELWRSDLAETVPAGTLVTGLDGTRYFAVKVSPAPLDAAAGEQRTTLRRFDP